MTKFAGLVVVTQDLLRRSLFEPFYALLAAGCNHP